MPCLQKSMPGAAMPWQWHCCPHATVDLFNKLKKERKRIKKLLK
jgi:hypothetical protein